jgi:hypothetical protein
MDSVVKKITQGLSEGMFNNLFTNPIYVALLITVIIVLIVVCMFNENKLIKTSFYIMCTTVFIIFIHNKLLLIEHRKQLCAADAVNICNAIDDGPSTSSELGSGLGYLKM